jgi:hypothetical protein
MISIIVFRITKRISDPIKELTDVVNKQKTATDVESRNLIIEQVRNNKLFSKFNHESETINTLDTVAEGEVYHN